MSRTPWNKRKRPFEIEADRKRNEEIFKQLDKQAQDARMDALVTALTDLAEMSVQWAQRGSQASSDESGVSS